MSDAVVRCVIAAAGAGCRTAAADLHPHAAEETLTREQARPSTPFEGRLFELFEGFPRGEVVGLTVPVWAVPGGAGPDPGRLVPVADHVNLEGRGPLTGPWPAGVPRDFPDMTGVYQPGVVRRRGGARVYSSGVTAAGVADARRLTRFEERALREGGWPIVSDSLVPVAVVAAYYGVKLAACGVVQAPRMKRE